MSDPIIHRLTPPPSNLSTPAARALDGYFHVWVYPEKGGGRIDWGQRLSLFSKIFTKDAIIYFPFAPFVVSPEMPQSPMPTFFRGYEEMTKHYTPFLSMGMTIIESKDASIQPFPGTQDYAFGQAKMIYGIKLPDGQDYEMHQEYTSQCRVNAEGIMIEYEEKFNPVAEIDMFKAFGAAMERVKAKGGPAATATENK